MTNADIQAAFHDKLAAAALGHPIAWPGVDFTPPNNGYWLEVRFLPNADLITGYTASTTPMKRGIYQVSVYGRPGAGEIGITEAAQNVASAFPREAIITGRVRVTRTNLLSTMTMNDRIELPVSIEYAG